MPVSFVLSPSFSALPAPARRAHAKRKRKRKRTSKPRFAKKAAKPKPHPPRVLTPQVRTILTDRLEAAIESGLVTLCDEDMPCESLDFTLAELALLQKILFPEEYLEPRESIAPTVTAPGSDLRLEAYARRAACGQSIYARGDATAVGAHARGLRIVQRGNGSGVKVVGWEE